MIAQRLVWLGGGYPPLTRDVTRNLTRAARALGGAAAVVSFDRGRAVLDAHWYEITAARAARNLTADPPRPAGLADWRHAWDAATELATLRIGGDLAAWLIAAPGLRGYRVHGGQMVSQWRRVRPGHALEALVVARAVHGRAPWPALPDAIEAVLKAVEIRQSGDYRPCPWLDWGDGHPGKLLTRRGNS